MKPDCKKSKPNKNPTLLLLTFTIFAICLGLPILNRYKKNTARFEAMEQLNKKGFTFFLGRSNQERNEIIKHIDAFVAGNDYNVIVANDTRGSEYIDHDPMYCLLATGSDKLEPKDIATLDLIGPIAIVYLDFRNQNLDTSLIANFIRRSSRGGVLRHVSLRNVKPMKDKLISSLVLTRGLKSLDLTGSHIENETLVKLASCVNLEDLNLTSTRVNSKCLQILKSFPALKHVELRNTQIAQPLIDNFNNSLKGFEIVTSEK